MSLRNSLPLTRSLLLIAFALALAVFASGCGLLGDDDENGQPSGRYTVLQAAIGTEINELQQLTVEPSRALPVTTNRVYAVVVLQGLEIGSEVTGRWYQLSTQNAPPDGSFVSEAGVTLTQDNITSDGAGRVALNLSSDSGALPAGDWLVRIYVNGEFIRTMGFVITPLVTASGQPPAQPTQATQPSQPEPSPTAGNAQPAPTATQAPTPQAQNYTVQPGDTLTLIANEFKGATESADAYVARLLELNDLAPGTILFVDQVLQLPPPLP